MKALCVLRILLATPLLVSATYIGAASPRPHRREPRAAACSPLPQPLVPRRRHLAPPKCALPSGDSEPQQVALRELLHEAGLTHEPLAVSEMSAGFCNWVYRVDMPAPVGSVVVKIFSPLAKVRLAPALRGLGDAIAGARGLGPRLIFRNPEGLITDFVPGDTLTEEHMHGASDDLPQRIAPRLAALHSTALDAELERAVGMVTGSAAGMRAPGPPDGASGRGVVLWDFLGSMVDVIAKRASALPPGICVKHVRGEVSRMRERFEALRMPVVLGHGDLKPSNVMATATGGAPTFIDFELAGRSAPRPPPPPPSLPESRTRAARSNRC